MEHPRTTKNVGQPCVICGQPANAQASVEALQAQVSELQGIADEKCRCFLERADQSEKQLTQCTAGLEALQRERKQAEQKHLQDVAYMRSQYDSIVAMKDEVQAALDAEREKVAFLEKKNANLVEASNLVLKVKADQDKRISTMQTELSQLQALVRVYGEAKIAFDSGRLREDHHAWKERFERLTTAEQALIAGLDATTPAPMDAAETHDRMFNHADRHPEAL